MRSWSCPLEHDGRKKHVEMYLVMHTGSVLPHWVLIRLFYGIALPCHVFYVTVLHDTFSFFFFSFFFWWVTGEVFIL